MIRNKITREISENSITLSLLQNGLTVRLTPNQRHQMLNVLNKYCKLMDSNFKCEELTWVDESVVFKRAKKPKKFSHQEVEEIKNAEGSIRRKAQKYKTSTRIISDIMHDRYLPDN